MKVSAACLGLLLGLVAVQSRYICYQGEEDEDADECHDENKENDYNAELS